MTTSVYISDEKIQVLTGAVVKGRLDVKACMFVTLPEKTMVNGVVTNEVALKESIEKLWSKYDLPKKDISLVVDSGTILNKKAKVPALPEATVLNLVQEEFKDVEGFSNFLFDYYVLEDGHNGQPEVLANAVNKELVAAYIRCFEGVGVTLKSICTALCSELKLVNLAKEFSGKNEIIVVLDQFSLTSVLLMDGKYSFASRTRLLDQRGTEQSEIEIARGLSSLVQFARSENAQKTISNIYLCGLVQGEEQLCSKLTGMMGINVSAPPVCAEVTYQGDKEKANYLISDYLYALGNMIRM